MHIVKTELEGVFVLHPQAFVDERGTFVKTFNEDVFRKFGLNTSYKESFHSVNGLDVIRGMHTQDVDKLVYVPKGRITDVVLDPKSGKYITVILSEYNHFMVYVPKGYAHGFLSMEAGTLVSYLQSDVHSPTTEGGVRYDSFGMDWKTQNPIVSQRDLALKPL